MKPLEDVIAEVSKLVSIFVCQALLTIDKMMYSIVGCRDLFFLYRNIYALGRTILHPALSASACWDACLDSTSTCYRFDYYSTSTERCFLHLSKPRIFVGGSSVDGYSRVFICSPSQAPSGKIYVYTYVLDI